MRVAFSSRGQRECLALTGLGEREWEIMPYNPAYVLAVTSQEGTR